MPKTRRKTSHSRAARNASVRRCARFRLVLSLALLALLAGVVAAPLIPGTACHADTPESVYLSGWGWCLAYRDVGNVTANLTGTMIPRAGAPEISDLFLAGTLQFNLADRTDSFELELRGTKVRSLFFLRQVTGGDNPVIAEFEGTWLDETDYVACEGRLAVPLPNHVAKPYVFVLRTPNKAVPSSEPGDFVANLEFSIRKSASAFDVMADRLAEFGDNIKELVGTVLTQFAVMVREIRSLGTPYFT